MRPPDVARAVGTAARDGSRASVGHRARPTSRSGRSRHRRAACLLNIAPGGVGLGSTAAAGPPGATGRQTWRTRQAVVDQPGKISGRAAPTGSATWCWSDPAGPARPPWSRRCSPPPEPSPEPGSDPATARRSATSRSPSRPTSAPSRWPSRPVVHRDTKINFVDTPGYADFVGEVRAGLRAADCALFVIAANEAVDDATRALWRECAEVGHAARRGDHQARPGPRRLRRRARRRRRRRSATRCCRSTSRSATGAEVTGLVDLMAARAGDGATTRTCAAP